MDSSLPSYEAAMREARAYLRRRDLSSQDEIPLYFAWQRLYAAANANLSTDFLHETRSELRARQDARLEPRRGIPPPLFTSFDKVNRTSAQASAFLRTGTSSQAAIEMMARRYRRDADKLRLSREKVVGLIDHTGKAMKKAKRRQKTPQEEVEELLESLEGSERLSEDEDLLSKTTKRGKQEQRRRTSLEDEDEDSLGAFANAQTSKKRASTMKNKLGAGGYLGGIGVAVNPVKAAELRRSTSSKINPVVPSFGTVENVAAFAAQVSDWRMPPDIDRASSAPELSHKGGRGPGLSQKEASLKSTVSGRRLSGANELREPGPIEGEGDMTLNSSGSSELDEDNFDPSATFNVDAARVSPTGNRSAAKDKRNFNSNQVGTKSDGRAEMARDGRERPTTDQQSQAVNAGQATISEFQQKLVQFSRAVGDMEVKIHGKKVKVTFHGELNDEEGSTRNAEALASSIKSDETKQPSPVKKAFGATGRVSVKDEEQETNVKNVAQGGVPAQRTNVGDREEISSKDWIQEKTQTNVPRKQGNVRFADTARSDDYKEDGDVDTTGSRQQQMRGASAEIPPVQAVGQPRQLRSSGRGSALNSSAAAESVLDGESDEETKEEETVGRSGQQEKERHEGEQADETGSVNDFGSRNLRQQMDKERQQERSDEEIEGDGVTEDENSSGERPDSRRSVSQHDRRTENEYPDSRTGRNGSAAQGSRPASHKLQRQTAEKGQHNRNDEEGMDENEGSIGERQAISQRDRRAEAEYQDARTGRMSGTQDSRPHSHHPLGSRKVQYQMDQDRQQMDEDGGSIGERLENRHSVSQRDRRAENEYPEARTGRNGPATQGSSPGSHKLQHQMVEEGQYNGNDEDGMDEDRSSIGGRQESYHSVSQSDRRTKIERQDVHTDGSKSVAQHSHPHSRDSERGQARERDDRSIEELDKERNVNVDQSAKPNRGQVKRSQRQFNSAREQNSSFTEHVSQQEVEFERSQRSDSTRERNLDIVERGSQDKVEFERPQRSDSIRERNSATARLSQQKVDFDQQSFSDASEDESEGRTSNEQEENSADESFVSEDQRSSSPSESSTRASSQRESVQEDRERLRTPRRSHNQSEENSVNSVSSDEELSDGPDTPYKQHKQRHHASRQSSRSKDRHEKLEKRRSSSKRSKYPPELSGNSETPNSRGNTSTEEIYRSRSRHSDHTRKSSRLPPPVMDSRAKSASKSRKTGWKLPKGIVWPPGMEEECIARLGLDGHHPIAPPGLEHLVTEEQWGEYWTWLHWYSSWQMWYMKNDKKPKMKTEKEKRRRRDNSPDDRQNARNANWWVGADSRKHRHRRERHD